jgi:hypothetical protein
MLAWIPFRAETVDLALGMYAKLFSANEWTYLGMRENIYLVTAVLLLLTIGTYWVQQMVMPRLKGRLWASFLLHSVVLGLAVSLVFIFLRPINQFIYFQF